MIIQAKALKADAQPTAAPHERYLIKNTEHRSTTPHAFGLMLIGLALYLRSIFPGWGDSEAAEEPAAKPTQDEAAGAPGETASADTIEDTLDPQATDATPSAGTEARPGTVGSGDNLVELQPPARFLIIPSRRINFTEFQLPEEDLLKRFGSLSFSLPQPANDNGGGSGGAGGHDNGRGTGGTGGHDNSGATESTGGDGDPGSSSDDDDDEEQNPNRAPRTNGPVYLYDVTGCAAALFGLEDLLRNAYDPDGDALSVRNLVISSGTLTQADGGWRFQASMPGPVTITYEITDGKLWVTQAAYFSVVKNPPIIGTDGADVLVGTECADDIDGGACDDNIDGRGGSDTINGGDGDDHIVAGSGDDIVFGGNGDDVIFGGMGNDWISGGKGNDRLFGDQGNDTIFGDEGNDYLHGGDGDDRLFGGEGADFAYGGAGRDIIHGGEGDDVLSGATGNDVLFGDNGADTLDGGEGDDVLSGGNGVDEVQGAGGNDIVIGDIDRAGDSYDGGDGVDTLDYSAAVCAIDVDLGSKIAQGAEIGEDEITGFEILKSGVGHDTIVGSDGNEEIYGNAGNDLIHGGGGDDMIADGQGCDTVDTGEGDDLVMAGADADNDHYDGGAGSDTLDYSASTAAVLIDLRNGTATGTRRGPGLDHRL